MIAPGTNVITTASGLGTMSHPEARGYESEIVGSGVRGVYFSKSEIEGYHLIVVPAGERALFCPVSDGMFETLA
jgi:hypothetical protein